MPNPNSGNLPSDRVANAPGKPKRMAPAPSPMPMKTGPAGGLPGKRQPKDRGQGFGRKVKTYTKSEGL